MNQLSSLIAANHHPTLLADGFNFNESPAADHRGNIYFVDVASNRLHHWDIANNKLTTIRENTGGANGLFVAVDHSLWMCEIRNKRISRLSPDGQYSIICDSYKRKPFTGPNDLWMDANGGVYFSDSYVGNDIFDATYRIFYYSPSGELHLVADDYYKSNGLQGTADGKHLYIADYAINKVYRYQIIASGHITDKTLFAEYRCDGMTMDELGNVYLCTGNAGQGIVVVNPQGEILGAIEVPQRMANVCFGGPDFKTLFISASTGFYSLAMNVAGNTTCSPMK